jgi:hypothetical protein
MIFGHLASDQPVHAAHQVFQQGELLGGQFDRFAVSRYLVRCGVQCEVRNLENAAFLVRVPAQQGAQPGPQLFHRERFDQVIVRPAVQPFYPIVDGIAGGEHQDGGFVPLLAQLPAQFKTIAFWQHDVEDDHIIRSQLGQLLSLDSIIGGIDGISLVDEVHLEGIAQPAVIFYDEYAHI